jgi:dihydroflavonol-4-reductase
MAAPFSQQRFFVTGGSGFVGSAVIRALLAAGGAVTALVRPETEPRNLKGLAVALCRGRLEEPESYAAALAGCGGLFHIAADYRLWVPDPAPMYRANVDGTRALFRAAQAAGIPRMVYTSSVAVLGIRPDGRPADETTPVTLDDMIGPYKRSKFLAEQEVSKLVAEAGAPIVIVNPSTPIGPRDVKPTPTGRIIVEAASGRMPAYVDTGLNIVHVDDVAAGHLLAFARGRTGERYILGGEDMSLAAMLTTIAELTGRRPPFVKLPRRAIYPLAIGAEAIARFTGREPFVTRDGLRMARKKMFFSSAKAVRELGYSARPAREALGDAIAWFRAAGACP